MMLGLTRLIHVCVLLLGVARVDSVFMEPREPDSDFFNYNRDPRDPLGVYNWYSSYPEHCNGNQQSPVNIISSHARYSPYLTCPGYSYATRYVSGKLTNNGNTVTFKPTDPTALSIINTPHGLGEYILNDFHLHYGGQSTQDPYNITLYPGSEHSVDDIRYDGEIHLVFTSVDDRVDQNGYSDEEPLIVAALFVQVLPDTAVVDRRFSNFLTDNIPLVTDIGDAVMTTADISMFFVSGCDYYTYTGSKTTPYCGETVRWIVYRKNIQVTQTAWSKLALLQSRGGFVSMYGNYRPTQPLNSRIVEFYTPPTTFL